MGLKYTPSADFTGVSVEVISADDNETISGMRFYGGRFLRSTPTRINAKNNAFAARFLFPRVFTQADSVAIHNVYDDYDWYGVDDSHLECIEMDLRMTLLKKREEILPLMRNDEYIHYYPHKYAAKHFNADTVLTYNVKFHDQNLQKIDIGYDLCKAILFQKKGRGYFVIYCLYNDDKQLKKHMRDIETMFRYDE